ncbi:MAG: hypothetical protein AAFY82_06890 [Pseudomonadota bacterium]
MEIKKRFTKRTCRYAGAALAAAVTTFIGWAGLAKADPTSCSLRDATAWQLALNDPQIEQTPDHILSVTEAFLAKCPNRPERYDASRLAGIAAADLGAPHRAMRHFQAAGAMRDLLSNFYAIATYMAADEPRLAWRLRDQMVERWRSRLERHPAVSVSAAASEHGMIYQVYFTRADEHTGVRSVWVGVPYGPGWPATLSFSKDPFRLGLKRIRTSEETSDYRYVDLHRCQGRRALGEIATRLSVTEFDAAASASLAAYMAHPDQPEDYDTGPVRNCVFPGRLLPSPPA